MDDPPSTPPGATSPDASRASAVLSGPHADESSRVLTDALRRAPFPSLAGLCFEVMGLAWVVGAFVGLYLLAHLFAGTPPPTPDGTSSSWFDVARLVRHPPPLPRALAAALLALPLVLLSVGTATGLARIAADGTRQGEGANAVRAWRLGRATRLSALGVWIQVAAMMTAATLVLFAPLTLLADLAHSHRVLVPIHAVLSGLAVAFAAVYGAGLGAVQELALTSLVRHERGVGSAVLHAWRLLRHRPATSRTLAFTEATSRLAVVATALALTRRFSPTTGLTALVILGALCGGIRCQAWSLAYPRVGGLPPQSRP